MQLFELEDITVVMPFILRLMKAFGLRGSRWDFVRFQFAVFWISLVSLAPKVFLGYRGDIGLAIRGVSEFIFQANVLIKMMFLVWKRDEFERMLTVLQELFCKSFKINGTSKQSSILARCNRRNDQFAKGHFIFCNVLVIFYSVSPVIQSAIIYRNYNQNNSTRPMELITHMAQEFYWLDIRTNIVHYGFYTLCVIPSYFFTCSILIVENCLIYCCCKCCSDLLDVVATRLRDLSTYQGDEQKDELKDIIAMHVDVLRCVELLKEIRKLPLLAQITNCVLMWCMMAVYLSMNFNANALNVLVVFIFVICETFGMCFLGSELFQKNVDVERAIYEFPWYNAPIETQKCIHRMLQRAQKHVGLSAAGFCYVDLERFWKLVHSAYQIFVVLKDTL